MFALVVTHADESRGSIAFIRVCVSVCLSVCPHDITKTAEITITKLATGMSPAIDLRSRSKGQRSRSHGHKVQEHFRRSSVHREFALYRVLPNIYVYKTIISDTVTL